MEACVKLSANLQNHEPERWISGTPGVYAWNVSYPVGSHEFMFRIDQRFIRAFTIFIGAFLRLLLAIILVAPIIACSCETRLRSVKRRSAERGREVYIIEAHSGSTNSSSDGGSKEEPAGHLG